MLLAVTQEAPDSPGLVARLKLRWQAVQDRNPWLRHVLRANSRVGEVRGSYFAAGITFFSFVSLFPLILVAVSVLGFVLASDPSLQTTLLNKITEQAGGSLGDTLKKVIQTAQANRAGIGVVGLVSGLLTGLGWISNLREATRAMWALPRLQLSFVKEKLADAVALGTLFAGIVASLAVTAAGTGLSGFLLRRTGLDHVTGARPLTVVIGIVVAVLANLLVFGWFLGRLPRVEVPRPILIRGAFLAAIGFEILTIIGTYYIKRVNASPAAGIFGSVLGVLVFVNLVARFLLFATAWVATGVEGELDRAPAPVEADPPVPDQPAPVSPAAVAGVLVGAGAALGGATVGLTARRFRRRAASR